MNRRSRAGCVDCRKAKVKCDERKPVCGTCSRRGKDCRGYCTESLPVSLKWRTAATNIDGSPSKRRQRRFSGPLVTNQHLIELDQGSRRVHFQDVAKVSSAVASRTQLTTLRAWSLDSPRIDDVDEIQVHHEFDESQRQSLQDTISFRRSPPDIYSHMQSLPWELSFFSNPNITPEKSRGVAIYFARHPAELVISSDPSFIQEMNSHVLATLQSNVEAVSDSLCAIGSVYLHNEGLKSSLELALGSKIKTLARIRRGTDAVLRDLSIEQSMSMILGVVSMELIDKYYHPPESSIPALHQAAAVLIGQFLSTGSVLSSTAKYMIRALARQDMIMALVHRKRPLIPTTAWLDEDCEQSTDRFMGFTATLMPLLKELCGLAEDLRNWHQVKVVGSHSLTLDNDVSATQSVFNYRVSDLRNRISTWHPLYIPTFSGPASLKFLLHADMYRGAALLYLHRLVHPHGNYNDEALTLAYDIFAHLSSEPRDNRLSLFPILLASCEFQREEDRRMAEECFESIHRSRNTYTTWLTGKFVKERIWSARDKGEEWGWACLVDRWEGECVPI